MEPQRRASVLRFGHYELDLHSREVRKGGMRIRVQQQPLKLLEILLERPGEIGYKGRTAYPDLAE